MRGSEKRTARATGLIALSALCFGSISVLTTLVTRTGTPLITAMFWRYALATVIIAGAVAWKHGSAFQLSPKLFIFGGFGQALLTYLSLSALDYISVAPLAFLFYTYPAWVAIVSSLRGVDRITPMRAIALVAALAGVAVIVGSPLNSSLNIIGVTLALASAVTYGVYLPAMSTLQRGVDSMVAALHVIVGAALAFGVAALLRGGVHLPTNETATLCIVVLALASTVGAFWMLLAGLAVLGPVRTAIVATIEPFFTMLLGTIVLYDRLSVRIGLGGMLIALAVIVIQRAGAPAREPITLS